MTMPLAIVAGPSSFVTLYEVYATPNAAGTAIVFTVLTDQSVQLQVKLSDSRDASVFQINNEASAAVGRRQFSVTLTIPTPQGRTLNWEITSLTAPPPTLRPQQGTVRIPGARTTTNGRALPVRWNMFGDGSRPAGGGGIGNWSSYTWSQYNPKGTVYPNP